MPAAPRFLCDAMLGRLARDLRLLGYDATYAGPEEDDTSILVRARAEKRLLVTKDRALAQRSGEDALLLSGPDELAEMVACLALRPARADFLSRCSECGAPLAEAPADARDVPEPVRARRETVARCTACGKAYWDGSHATAIRERLSRFLAD